ncbi:MAG: NosD domain-containing protein [Nitrososphaerota archaeon]|nr:NosD domain-containing protein [Nitrososphaerota archaeon]
MSQGLTDKTSSWHVHYEGVDESAYRFNLEKRVSGLEMWLYVADERVGWDKDWIKIVLAGYPITVHTPKGAITVKPILGVMKIGYKNDIQRNAGGLHVAYYILPTESEIYYVNVTIHVPRGNPRLDVSRSLIKEWTPEAVLQVQGYQSGGWGKYDVINGRGRAALASFGVSLGDRPMHSLLDFAFGKAFRPPANFAWKPDVYVEFACVGGINIAPESFVGVGNYSCNINVGIGRGTSLTGAVSSGLSQTIYKVRAGKGSPPPYVEEAASGSIDIFLDLMDEVGEALLEPGASLALGTVLKAVSYALWVYELAQIGASLGFNEIVSTNRVLVFKNFEVKDGFCVWFRFFAEVASAGFAGGIVNFWGEFPFGSSIFDDYGYSITELKDEKGSTIEGGMWIGGILIDYYNPAFRGDGPITIRPDGTVEPFTVPLATVDYINYELHGDISFGIEIRRENVVLDGCNHTINLISPRIGGHAVGIAGVSNVVVKNLNIKNCAVGIILDTASNCTITSNIITDVYEGIYVAWSKGNVILNNHITHADVVGVELEDSEQNIIVKNELVNCKTAILLERLSHYNSILKNNLTSCGIGVDISSPSSFNHVMENNILKCGECGISLGGGGNKITGNKITGGGFLSKGVYLRWYSSSNNISENCVSEFSDAIHLEETSKNMISFNNIVFNINGFYFTMHRWPSENNTIFGNNMMNNTYNFYFSPNSAQNTLVYNNNFLDGGAEKIYGASSASVTWDNGYPCGGNHWRDYKGKDGKRGPSQDIEGSDGIGDTPYTIDEQNIDNYPLMEPFGELLPLTYNYQPENVSIKLISNSVVSNFVCDLTGQKISFEVYWRSGTKGSVLVDVPKNVFKGKPEVFFDGKPVPFNHSDVDGLTRISFSYEHSRHYVEIRFSVWGGTPPPPSPSTQPPEGDVQNLVIVIIIITIASLVTLLFAFFLRKAKFSKVKMLTSVTWELFLS